MMKHILTCALIFSLSTLAAAESPRVWLDTDHGPIILELDEVRAPVTTDNFMAYVDEGFYDGIIFHRVIPDFVIQSGGHTETLELRQPTRAMIQSESANGLKNEPGTIAMALAGENVNSAQTQFYINTAVNDFLDPDFTVFGRVIFGLGVVETIENTPVWRAVLPNFAYRDTPVRPPLIKRAVRVNGSGFPIMVQHTGSWYDVDNPGAGFNVEVAADTMNETGARLVVYWYDFIDGQQLWLLGVGSYSHGDTSATMDLITWDGNNQVDFQNPPPGDSFVSVGTLTVSFEDCLTGRFTFDVPTMGNGELTVNRLSLPEGAVCEGF
jgi:peptidyl-prolyl cis-trans isomerase A (cyclophilin A)